MCSFKLKYPWKLKGGINFNLDCFKRCKYLKDMKKCSEILSGLSILRYNPTKRVIFILQGSNKPLTLSDIKQIISIWKEIDRNILFSKMICTSQQNCRVMRRFFKLASSTPSHKGALHESQDHAATWPVEETQEVPLCS